MTADPGRPCAGPGAPAYLRPGHAARRDRPARRGPGVSPGSSAAYQRTPAHLTVRTRVLAAVLVLASLAVLIAGGTAFALQWQRADARIDASLARAVDDLRTTATGGAATADLAPAAATVEDLLYVAVQRAACPRPRASSRCSTVRRPGSRPRP